MIYRVVSTRLCSRSSSSLALFPIHFARLSSLVHQRPFVLIAIGNLCFPFHTPDRQLNMSITHRRTMSLFFLLNYMTSIPLTNAWNPVDFVDPGYAIYHTSVEDITSAQKSIIASADIAANDGPWSMFFVLFVLTK